jgi:hypothetical protein
MKAYRETGWRCLSLTLRLPYPQEGNLVTLWMCVWVGLRANLDRFCVTEKCVAPTGIRTCDRPSRKIWALVTRTGFKDFCMNSERVQNVGSSSLWRSFRLGKVRESKQNSLFSLNHSLTKSCAVCFYASFCRVPTWGNWNSCCHNINLKTWPLRRRVRCLLSISLCLQFSWRALEWIAWKDISVRQTGLFCRSW